MSHLSNHHLRSRVFLTFEAHVWVPCKFKVLKGFGCKKLKLQIGHGVFTPEDSMMEGVQISFYRFKDSIQQDLAEADLVISHAGAGSCLETLELEKPLLAVINEDLMNNHQFEVAKKLSDSKYLHYTTCGKLLETIQYIDFSSLRTYPKRDPKRFVKAIDCIMGFPT
ncbi:UDP-N-acetylglucosamine transferase subunit ALG13 homolog isoform X2 [Cimex lectularius]|uniref:UDP-N-acetylglucosamine transferase subunit ALG13 n=1 Tax=Cimex lectularius TaxID=79782 RepID=A0A8I6TGW3_CIMLE|nr:UDP-N-acetylglucosamine transferase subunit ALG13 homolog isoform X2 [Cimex lectularius]